MQRHDPREQSQAVPSNPQRPSLAAKVTTRLTRRGLIAGGGIAGAGLVIGQLDLLRSAAQDSAEIRQIIDPLATLEALAVTMTGVGRERGKALEISTEASRFLRAAQCEDEAHYHFFTGAGATATETFSLGTSVFRTRRVFLTALLELKEIAVGAMMAATRQFSALDDPRLVEIAYQIGAVEAQHLALARLFLNEQIPNDRAFARWRFSATSQAIDAITEAGYLADEGERYAFPGPLSRQCRGVFGLVPETTDDQLPPIVSPVASPVAT